MCARSGKNGKLTVRTQDESDDVQTGSSPGTLSVLDVTFDTKFYVGGVVGQAVDTVSLSLSHIVVQFHMAVITHCHCLSEYIGFLYSWMEMLSLCQEGYVPACGGYVPARFTRCLEGMVCNGCMFVCLSVDAGSVDKCPVYQVSGRHGV